MDTLPRREYFAQLHKLPLAAGVLFFDEEGNVLVVKPTYRADYLIPGGMVEADESPASAALREVREELGLTILSAGPLIAIDYKPRTNPDFDDASIQFVFNGGSLSAKQRAEIRLDREELASYLFANPEEAVALCNPNLGKRLTRCFQAIKDGTTLYLEKGIPPAFTP